MKEFPQTVAIIGSRYFFKLQYVTDLVNELNPGTTVVSGGAIGVDRTAEIAARKRSDLPEPVIFLPRPEIIRTKGIVPAFFARNREIVDYTRERDGIVVAFCNVTAAGEETSGTKNSLRYCEKDGQLVPYIVFRMQVKQDGKDVVPVGWHLNRINEKYDREKMRSWLP